MFGSDKYGIEPDLITVPKGLTSAYFFLSGWIVSEKVYKVLEKVYEVLEEGAHNAAAAFPTAHLLRASDGRGRRRRSWILSSARTFPTRPMSSEPAFKLDRPGCFSQLPIVGEARGVGMMGRSHSSLIGIGSRALNRT